MIEKKGAIPSPLAATPSGSGLSEEKQIEEMAKDLQKSEHWYFNDHSVDFELDRKKTAENFYNAGYRKQKEGEWKRQQFKSRLKFLEYNDFTCIECGETFEVGQGKEHMHFCPNCGAKMKGGAE